MSDTYKNFSELMANAVQGSDYVIESEDRGSVIAVVAIHGGLIERGTAELARLIADDDLSYYVFKSDDESLHLTSRNFDDPTALSIVNGAGKVISVHGKKGADEFIMVGGLDEDLIMRTSAALVECGIETREPEAYVAGNTEENICNRGASGKGLQLEISRGLRDRLLASKREMQALAKLLREVAGVDMK